MSIAQTCPYNSDYENCKYEKYYGEPTLEKCDTCDRYKKENKDIPTKSIYKNYIIGNNNEKDFCFNFLFIAFCKRICKTTCCLWYI